MSIFRLLPFSLLIAAGVATLAAQSSPEKTPGVIRSPDSEWTNSSASTYLRFPNLNAEPNQSNPLERILIGDYRPQLSQFVPHTLLHTDPDGQPQGNDGDNTCLKMRVYKVARDNPQSDSTHAAGYSTCQPTSRFRTHSVKGVIVPAAH